MLYTVYGPAQHQNKQVFLSELANTCSKESLPYLIGGDFNIMRRLEDKSSGVFDFKWPNLFNAVIESLDLKEIVMSGHQYTWAVPGDNPIFEKLDRVLASTDWEDKFPLSTVEPRDRDISDHTPLVLNTGASTHQIDRRHFKFERGWLIRDSFYDMVAKIWQSETTGRTPLERWQNKLRRLRQHLRGWAKHTAGIYRKEKKKLLALLENLDKKAESVPLSDQEINFKHFLKERLGLLLKEEEIK